MNDKRKLFSFKDKRGSLADKHGLEEEPKKVEPKEVKPKEVKTKVEINKKAKKRK